MSFGDLAQALAILTVLLDGEVIQYQRISADVLAFETGAPHACEVSAGGITLNEYPGRRFQFSSVSTSAADMSARILGEKNDMTRVLRPSELKNPHAPARRKPAFSKP